MTKTNTTLGLIMEKDEENNPSGFRFNDTYYVITHCVHVWRPLGFASLTREMQNMQENTLLACTEILW